MRGVTLVLLAMCCGFGSVDVVQAAELRVIRANQIGYFPDDAKMALLSTSEPQAGRFAVGDFTADIGADQRAWGPFKHNYRLDFSSLKTPGRYEIRFGDVKSLPFEIGPTVYDDVPKRCLGFLRLQRCGDTPNPVTGKPCHLL